MRYIVKPTKAIESGYCDCACDIKMSDGCGVHG